jgi:hypothetical protein
MVTVRLPWFWFFFTCISWLTEFLPPPGYIRVGFVSNPTQRLEFSGAKTSSAGRLKFSSLVFT